MARHNLKRTAPQYAGLQSCSQTPIHARSKTANGAPSSKSSSVGTLGPVAAQGRTGGVNPSNMCLRAAGCTSPTMVANDRDSVPGQFQSLLGCASPLWGSNPRPYAYEAHALPAELKGHVLCAKSTMTQGQQDLGPLHPAKQSPDLVWPRLHVAILRWYEGLQGCMMNSLCGEAEA